MATTGRQDRRGDRQAQRRTLVTSEGRYELRELTGLLWVDRYCATSSGAELMAGDPGSGSQVRMCSKAELQFSSTAPAVLAIDL